ncbi:hypothetical protein L209DRAFT_759989 [Thermothelomyces heterothallicus CBS 203.75]
MYHIEVPASLFAWHRTRPLDERASCTSTFTCFVLLLRHQSSRFGVPSISQWAIATGDSDLSSGRGYVVYGCGLALPCSTP